MAELDTNPAQPGAGIPDEEIVTRVLNLTQLGEASHRERVKRYDRAYAVYRANSDERPVGTEPWQSKLRVPFALQTIDTALVNMVSGTPPRCLVTPRTPEDELGAKGMQKAMDYYTHEDHLVDTQSIIAQSGLVYGMALGKNHWLYKTQTRKVREKRTGPLGDQVMVPTDVQLVTDDRPTLEPWNIYDSWWDPNGRDVDSCAYIVLRSWARMDDLRAMAFNPETGRGVYRNLDALAQAGPGRTRQSSQQERFLNTVAQKRKGMVELLEVWHVVRGEIYVAVIGNRQVLLRYSRSPYWHGKFPIVAASTRPDLFEMQGIPETELVDHLQQAMWTVQNMRFDNMHLSVMRGITYREGGVTDPNTLVLKPRFKWAVSDHDDIRPFEVQPLPPEAYREEEGLLSRMQLVTGITPFISGASQQPGVDQNTATGVSVLQEVASRLLRFKAAQLENRIYQRSYEMWGDMVQQFLDHDVSTKVVDPDTRELIWTTFGPQEVVGDFHFKLEGSDESLSKSQQRNEAVQLLNAFAPLVPTGLINLKPLLEKVAEAYDIPNPDSLLTPAPAPAAPAAPGAGQGANLPNVLGPRAGAINLPPQMQGGPQLQGGAQMPPQVLNRIMQGR